MENTTYSRMSKWYRIWVKDKDGSESTEENFLPEILEKYGLKFKTAVRHADGKRFYLNGRWIDLTFIEMRPRIVHRHRKADE